MGWFDSWNPASLMTDIAEACKDFGDSVKQVQEQSAQFFDHAAQAIASEDNKKLAGHFIGAMDAIDKALSDDGTKRTDGTLAAVDKVGDLLIEGAAQISQKWAEISSSRASKAAVEMVGEALPENTKSFVANLITEGPRQHGAQTGNDVRAVLKPAKEMVMATLRGENAVKALAEQQLSQAIAQEQHCR